MYSGLQSIRSTLLRLSLLVFILQGVMATAQVTRLLFRPLDAVYSRSVDRLILVSANPNQLHIYNVASQSDQIVPLSDPPLDLSLSPDGTHAAVAFSNAIAYVDLQGATVERTFISISVGTGKVVVGAGYIYVMPSYQGNPTSVNLANGQTQSSSFIYGAGGVFDPATNAVYSTQDGLSPNSINRYDASSVLVTGTRQPVAYWGALPICGPLSLSDDNTTIYTGCGTVFRASTDPDKDMRYLGILPGIRTAGSVVHSGALNQLAVIPRVQSYDPAPSLNDDTVVNLFDSAFFNPVGRLAITPFTVNSRSYPAHGRWAFYNSSSSALIIISQADSSASVTQDFAIENVDLRNTNSCNAVFGGASASISAAGSYATTPILSGQDCLFTAVSNSSWITLSSGYFGSGDTSLTYLVRPNLSSAPRSGTISIGSQVFTINQDGQPSGSALTPLSFKPVSADYNKALDRMVMVSAFPNELHVYDPVTQDDQIISLNAIPLSVSVRPDGLFAAVGNKGSISIIDLTAHTVTQTIPIDMDTGGIILASNGYAYAFSSGGPGNIYSVQLSTGTLTPFSGSPFATSARLDPSGRYIYVGSGYSSASKLDISNGPVAVSSMSFAASGNVWLSESGDRLLTSTANSYLTSPVPSLDFTPNGRLSSTNTVAWAANSQRLGQTAILTDINSTANTQLQIYADNGLQLQGQTGLPGFASAGANFISHGRYLFWNAGASKLFALIQADSTSGMLSDFAVYTIDSLDSIPACTYGISPAQLTVPPSGNQGWFIDVTSNCSWYPSVAGGGNAWISSINSSGYTTGNGRAFLFVSSNFGSERSASINIGDKTAVITQLGAGCTYSLVSSSGSFSQAGGAAEVNLLTAPDCRWSIQSSVSWVSIRTSQSGTGPSTITYSVDPNTMPTASRSGALNIAGQNFSIFQTNMAVSAPSDFLPITPCRIADTRNAPGPFGGPFLSANSTRTFQITNSNCNIPSSATAYSLNITVVPRGPLNYLTAWPNGQAQPFVSTLNSGDGRVKANAAIISAGPNKAISFYTTDATDLIVDITGYFVDASTESGLAFYPLSPCRISDTREANGPLNGPVLTGGENRQLPILQSGCNLNTSAQAYSLNFTAIPDEDTLQYLTTWPSGQGRPVVSTLNSWTGSVTANAAILQAGSAGDINVYVTEDSHLATDTNGYFAPAASGGLHFYSVAPCRALDTRAGLNSRPIKGVISVQVSGRCSVPTSASAVVVNATVIPSLKLDYLTLWPSGKQQPFVSTLNAFDGAISSNMAIVPVSGGLLNAFATDNTHLILDVTGYFAP